MAESFRCPSCSAPLEFEGTPVQKCRFCGGNVIVPSGVVRNSNVFGGAGHLDFGDLSSLTGRALKIAEIQSLIQSGQKIEAIKVFRETFGVGLKEAKDAVEAMERGEGIDISGMRIHTQKAHVVNLRQNAQNLAAAKKVGVAVGGWFVLTFVIAALLVVGVVVGILVFASNSVEQTIHDSAQRPPNIAVPRTVKAEEASIAQETLKFGGEGTGAGKFKDNRAIAVGADGKIFTADYQGGRIQVFDANGNFLSQILTGTDRVINTIAVDRKGNLFVLQGSEIHRFSAETGANTGKFRLGNVSDFALGLDGKLYVAGQRGEITVLSADGAKLKTILIGKELNLQIIEEIEVDGAGNFFLLDGKDYAVFKLAPDGKLLTRFGGRVSAAPNDVPKGMFYGNIRGLAIDSQGRVFISQVSRVSVFDANGNYLNEFKTTQAFGMVFNDKDELFVAARPFVVKYKVSL